MQGLPQEGTSEKVLNNREERFCYAFVNTGDKYKAFDLAKYEASTDGAKAAAVSRMLKRPWIKARIKVLEREYYEAMGVDEKRILGNVAAIAFNKDVSKPERLRALELLGKERAMWIDRSQEETGSDVPKDPEARKAYYQERIELIEAGQAAEARSRLRTAVDAG